MDMYPLSLPLLLLLLLVVLLVVLVVLLVLVFFLESLLFTNEGEGVWWWWWWWCLAGVRVRPEEEEPMGLLRAVDDTLDELAMPVLIFALYGLMPVGGTSHG